MIPFSPFFASPCPLIGMVHLAPLPGSPRWGGSVAAVIDRACQDARVLAEAGIDGIIVENFGDTPFAPGRVEAVTVAAMTVATRAVKDTVSAALTVGVNVLRADTRSAIAIAMVTGAAFVRTNVLTGALVTDQGIIQGDAYSALRERRSMGAEISLLADVLSKHAAPIAHGQTLELEARAIAYRGLADALIVTGDETAVPTSGADLRRVKAAVPDRPVLIGSGLDETNIAELLPLADGAILGSALKVNRETENPVDPDRVRRIVDLARRVRG